MKYLFPYKLFCVLFPLDGVYICSWLIAISSQQLEFLVEFSQHMEKSRFFDWHQGSDGDVFYTESMDISNDLLISRGYLARTDRVVHGLSKGKRHLYKRYVMTNCVSYILSSPNNATHQSTQRQY